MKKKEYYLSLDLEGMSGFRDGREHNRNLEILQAHALACIAGISRTGNVNVKVKSFHGKLPEGLPLNAEPAYSTSREDFDLPNLEADCCGLFLLGFHGLEPECGHGHSYRWPYLILNGKRIGEITVQILLAATLGVPTLFFGGDEFGVAEARSLVPGITALALRPGIQVDEGELDKGLLEKIAEKAELAALRSDARPLPLEESYRIEVPMRKEAEADEAMKLSAPLQREGQRIIFETNDFLEAYRFLMTDLWHACDRVS